MGWLSEQWKQVRGHAKWELIKWLVSLLTATAISAAYVLLQKLRHLTWDWWAFGGVFAMSLVLIAIMHRRMTVPSGKSSQQKLVIHHAVYGAGPATDIDVTETLRNAPRDGLVIPVDNSLVPRDPIFGTRKRLVVDYSYGDGTVCGAYRVESAPGEPTRLVLPEDSELIKLQAELRRLQQEHAAEKPRPVQPSIQDHARQQSSPLGRLPVYRQDLTIEVLAVRSGVRILGPATVFMLLKTWAKKDLNLLTLNIAVSLREGRHEAPLLRNLSEWIVSDRFFDQRYGTQNTREANLEDETLSLLMEIESGIFREGHHRPKWVACEMPNCAFVEEKEIQAIRVEFRDKEGAAKTETFTKWPETNYRIFDVAFKR